MAHLPVVPKIGGKKDHGLKLKSDMGGIGSGKSKPKIVGSMKKNPGKMSGGKA
jgi:hypothetical protein